MSGRRLDVTPTQAVSSMMAALTGAIAASRLGIAGTMIGAAFMSLASTVGAAVYKHYLARSNERLRAAASNLAPKASANAVAAAVRRHHLHLEPGEHAHLRPDGRAVADTRDDGDAQPAGRTAAAFGRGDFGAAAVAADIAAAVVGDHSTLGHASLGHTAAERPAAGPAGGDRNAGDRGRLRRRWLRLAGVVLGVFAVAMGGVTAVEAIAGKPLETLIWHRTGSGTTIGSVVGHPARHQPAIVPSYSPAPSQSPSAQPSSTSPGLVSPTPTSTPTSTPTPTDSVPPSPGTSSTPSAGPSAGTGSVAPGTTPAPGQ